MGNAVLNMTGTGRWTPGAVSERPTNFREKILYLWPNSPAILTMISGKLKSEAVNDPKFTIFEKGLPTMRQPVASQGGSGNVELTFATTLQTKPTSIYRPGQVIMNENTLEIMWVVSIDSDTQITVVRGGSMGASTVNVTSGDYILVIGNHNAEGATTPNSLSFNPTTRSNYTQIWRTPLKLTGTAKETYLQTGEIEKELKREAAERHAIEMEWSAIFGKPYEGTTNSQYDRTTGGFIHFMSEAPAGNIVDFEGALTRNAWEGFLESLFAVPAGGSEKLCLCGNKALTSLNQMAQAYGQIQLNPGGDAYGLKLMRYETPYGTLQLKGHPLLSQNPAFADWGLVVDTKNFLYRPLKNRDTEYLQNRQGNGEDAIIHEFQTEGGWEIRHPSTHGYFKNAATFQP